MEKYRRAELTARISWDCIGGMDIKEMQVYIAERLEEYYNGLDDDDFKNEIENYYDCDIADCK